MMVTHPVIETNLQRGLDIALGRVMEREKQYPLGRFSHYTMLLVLRAANDALDLDLMQAEAMFANADPGERSNRNLHHEYEGLVQLTLYPGHIVLPYTAVEETAVLQFLAAVHLALFGNLPACNEKDADLSFTRGCQACRSSKGLSYSVLRIIGQASRDGVLLPGYRPPTPDEIHAALMSTESIFSRGYRHSLAEGRTPLNMRASAWLRYNGTVPEHLWPTTETPAHAFAGAAGA